MDKLLDCIFKLWDHIFQNNILIGHLIAGAWAVKIGYKFIEGQHLLIKIFCIMVTIQVISSIYENFLKKLLSLNKSWFKFISMFFMFLEISIFLNYFATVGFVFLYPNLLSIPNELYAGTLFFIISITCFKEYPEKFN